MMVNMRKMSVVLALFLIAGMAYTAEIKGVTVRQQWPWSRKVEINYTLECSEDHEYDVQIKAFNGDASLELPMESLSGNISNVGDGVHRIVWDPMVTDFTDRGALTNFRVELTPVRVPLYIIIDLTKPKGDANQFEYVYEEKLTNDLWGAWERNPITNATGEAIVESVIWTGVTTNDIYKTDKLVMRRVPAGTFGLGSSSIETTLSRDYYIGVFEVTQHQWSLFHSRAPGRFISSELSPVRPAENMTYNMIRGAMNSTPVIDWPTTGHKVLDTSYLGLLRAESGLQGFDLPTSAQWEYAARAGTKTYYNDGLGTPSNTSSNEQADLIGRYMYNGGYVWNSEKGEWETPLDTCEPNQGTAVVGSYKPNAWGLYDVHGNVREWTLDWSVGTHGGVDPVGVESGTSRRTRGGGYAQDGTEIRIYNTVGLGPSFNSGLYGFRLVMNVQ